MREALKESVEYALALALLKGFGRLPRPIAYPAGRAVAWLGYHLAARQRRAALQNLEAVMPELSPERRDEIVRGVFNTLGRLLVEFSHFPDLSRENIGRLVERDGLENFENAVRQGRGTIILTGHIGAWELSVFAHAVYGHPMKFLSRAIDNRRVDQLVTGYRTRSGNVPIDKREAAREVLRALRKNEVVGILADANTVREEAVFVPFLGRLAATTKGVATFALRTGAAVVPGYLVWEAGLGKYRLRFDPAIEIVDTGDFAADVATNTSRFNEALGRVIRQYPDQWLWIHRRWKTQP